MELRLDFGVSGRSFLFRPTQYTLLFFGNGGSVNVNREGVGFLM